MIALINPAALPALRIAGALFLIINLLAGRLGLASPTTTFRSGFDRPRATVRRFASYRRSCLRHSVALSYVSSALCMGGTLDRLTHTIISMKILNALALINPAALPALRIAGTIFLLLNLIEAHIFLNRHRFFDRDPDVENDIAAVRHMRVEVVLIPWLAVTAVTPHFANKSLSSLTSPHLTMPALYSQTRNRV